MLLKSRTENGMETKNLITSDITWQGLRIKSWWVFYNEIFSELEYITVNVHAIIWTCILTYPFTLIANYHISKLLKKYYIYPQMAKFFHFVLKITLHQWSMTTVNKLNKVGYQFITLVYSFVNYVMVFWLAIPFSVLYFW